MTTGAAADACQCFDMATSQGKLNFGGGASDLLSSDLQPSSLVDYLIGDVEELLCDPLFSTGSPQPMVPSPHPDSNSSDLASCPSACVPHFNESPESSVALAPMTPPYTLLPFPLRLQRPPTLRERLGPQEYKKRRNAFQRMYRIARKARQDFLKRQVEDSTLEIQRLQHENLVLSHRVGNLKKIVAYRDELLASVSSNVGFIPTQKSASDLPGSDGAIFCPVYLEFISHLREPNDEQLETMLNHTVEHLKAISCDFVRRLHGLLARWLADPAGRQSIGVVIDKMMRVYDRLSALLMQHRPRDAARIVMGRMLPSGPYGEPHHKTLKMVELLRLSLEQKEALKAEWLTYCQRVATLRDGARGAMHVAMTACSNSTFCGTDGCTPSWRSTACAAAQYQLRLSEAVAVLRDYSTQEATAMLQLAESFHCKVLSHVQRVAALAATSPYAIDMLQLCAVLFGAEGC